MSSSLLSSLVSPLQSVFVSSKQSLPSASFLEILCVIIFLDEFSASTAQKIMWGCALSAEKSTAPISFYWWDLQRWYQLLKVRKKEEKDKMGSSTAKVS